MVEYIDGSCRYDGPDDYVEAVRKTVVKRLADCGLRAPQDVVSALADTEVDNASRGCRVALKILTCDVSVNLNPCSFYEHVVRECEPMNGCFLMSESAHFCFNSLGFIGYEEVALKCLCAKASPMLEAERLVVKAVSEEAMKRLKRREPALLKES
jgi:hypothetical protein